MEDANKFVWAYMIESGVITTGKWSYYGGSWDLVDGYDIKKHSKRRDKMLKDIKDVGIDWSRTSIPETSVESAFTDSFHPSEEVETLLGTLVLKDNSTYYIGVSNAEHRFTSYAQSLMQLAADKQRVKDILGE